MTLTMLLDTSEWPLSDSKQFKPRTHSMLCGVGPRSVSVPSSTLNIVFVVPGSQPKQRRNTAPTEPVNAIPKVYTWYPSAATRALETFPSKQIVPKQVVVFTYPAPVQVVVFAVAQAPGAVWSTTKLVLITDVAATFSPQRSFVSTTRRRFVEARRCPVNWIVQLTPKVHEGDFEWYPRMLNAWMVVIPNL
jgi:hypothetical protein